MPRSAPRGSPTSAVELTNVSAHGFWVLLDGRELFLGFSHFPWFRDATISQLAHVERPSSAHLRWPALDVDLPVEAIEHPERYPLVSHQPVGVHETVVPPVPRSAKARPAAKK